jgi:UV DNA damage repair endonuclease
MADLQTHIQIFKALPIPNKRVFIKLIWHIATEHGKEISLDDFIKAISYLPPTNAVQPLRKE